MKDHIREFDEEKLREAFKIKQAYTSGEIDLELANAQMKAHVGSLTPIEIAYMEQVFQEKVDDECIKEDIDKMMAIYDGVLIDKETTLVDGHPIKNYLDENIAIRKLISDIESLFTSKYIKNIWDEKFESLNDYKIHLSRKQNQLYSELEKRGFDRPTTTMWLYDNEIRDRISSLLNLVSREFSPDQAENEFKEFKEYILDLMDKEETVLYPTALEMLSDDDFFKMISGDREIGYCLIEPSSEFEETFLKKNKNQTETLADSEFSLKDDLLKLLSKHKLDSSWSKDTKMDVSQGLLSLNQINLIFKHLPVDISYVDENDIVAFYSDTKHRVFPRSKGVIGRNVKNCHPSNSIEKVEEIISKFRSGEKDRVDFWINKPGVFIYILYIAVRDEDGRFRGVLEMMQDCTRIRGLKDSMTLLNWESDEEDKSTESDNDFLVNDKKNDKITLLKNDTRLYDLLKDYPGLKDYMISKSEKFSIMNSPMFKFMLKKADVGMISERTGFSLELLQSEFTKYIDSL